MALFIVMGKTSLGEGVGSPFPGFTVRSEGYNSLSKTSLANAGGLAGGLMFVRFP